MNKSDNYPSIVYKYRNWTDKYHKDVLYENQLFLPSPKDFNDPFDCRITSNYYLLDTNDKIDEYVNQAISRHYKKLIHANLDIEKEKSILKHRLTFEMDKLQQEHEESFFENQDKFFGILSLSERWDSILMWSHYADNHKGYCVGFSEKKLRESGHFGKGGQVYYHPENKYPELDPRNSFDLNQVVMETQSKAYDWSYEQEFRLAKLFYPNVPTDDDRTIKIDDDSFSEIIIGLKTPKKDRTEIIDLAKQKGIKVYDAVKVAFKFEVDRKIID